MKCFKAVAVLLLFMGITACNGQHQSAPPVADWKITIDNVQLSVSPGQIPVETLLSLQLRSHNKLQAVSGQMVGKSMYMGKIPLRFTYDAASGFWVSEFMLGACSDPKMIWQLNLQLTDQSGNVRQLATELQSSWR
jgi:hypothetical protein